MAIKRHFFILLGLTLVSVHVRAAARADRLVPLPVQISTTAGEHTLRPDGKDVRVSTGGSAFRRLVAGLPDFSRREAYRLSVTRRKVRIEAQTEEGVFRACQTLRQLALQDSTLACCTITDYPRLRHRGLLIDESRSFKGKDFLFRQMDAMALLKLNVLHLHLVDAAGWRLEIKSHPELTQRAAWRLGEKYSDWEKQGYPFSAAGAPGAYGGYYTQEDIRDILAYAAARYIRVIPEIEMPGHSMEVNRCYPELSCLNPDGTPRPFAWDLCAGNEAVYRLLEDILGEVMDLFPSEYIHIGGDEAVMKDWPVCVRCRELMAREGMKEVNELQGYMVRRIHAFVQSKGRRVIGWDEILETGLPAGAAVMSWRGVDAGRKAAADGRDVVMCPTTHCYLDYYQDLIRKEPKATGPLNSLRHAYSFDPCAGMTPDEAQHVLGLQGNLWCELIHDGPHAEYMLYPRAFAIAEIGWSPQERREWRGFRERARTLCTFFHTLGYRTFDLEAESQRARSVCFERGRTDYNFVEQLGGAPTLSFSHAGGAKVLVEGELGFLDLNADDSLQPFEDWRLPASERAADLKARLEAGESMRWMPDPAFRDIAALEELFSSGRVDNPYKK